MRQNSYPETPTYTDGRATDTVTVTERTEDGVITTDAGWSWHAHPSMGQVTQGTVMLVETTRGSQVVGVATGDLPDPDSGVGWLFRKSDQVLHAEWGEYRNDLRVTRARELREHRADYQRREAALPAWLRERLQWFHLRGGEDFEAEGWGYELVICELAALYAADDDWIGQSIHGVKDALGQSRAEEPEAVMQVARELGTSGNQHGMAQSLALAHAKDPSRSFAGTVSALSPLTGDPDYGGGQDVPTTSVEDTAVTAPARVMIAFRAEGEQELVVEHPMSWEYTEDPDAISAYAQSALDALNAAGLLRTAP